MCVEEVGHSNRAESQGSNRGRSTTTSAAPASASACEMPSLRRESTSTPAAEVTAPPCPLAARMASAIEGMHASVPSAHGCSLA